MQESKAHYTHTDTRSREREKRRFFIETIAESHGNQRVPATTNPNTNSKSNNKYDNETCNLTSSQNESNHYLYGIDTVIGK